MPSMAYKGSMSKEELREWRTSRKLTQLRLGQLLGVAMITVQSWENGYSPVPAWLGNGLVGVQQKLEAQESD